MGIGFENYQDDHSHLEHQLKRAVQQLPQALPFGVVIAELRPLWGRSQHPGTRKKLAVVFKPGSLQPAAEAGLSDGAIHKHLA